MVRTARQSFIILILIPYLSGCGGESREDAGGRAFRDARSHLISVPERIERIATLAPGVTEIVATAGGFERIVGVSNADDYPEEVSRLPSFSALPVNYEAVASLEPDVVFASTQVNDYRDVDVFANLGVSVFFLPGGNLQEVLASIETVGEMLNTTDRASSSVEALRRRIDALRARRTLENPPRVLFLISYTRLHAFGPESYIHELIELAGGRSITAGMEVENPILDDEFVLTHAPDVILGTFGDDFVVEDLLAEHPTWASLPAVSLGCVHSVDNDLFLRAGPRLVDGAEQIVDLIECGESP